MSFDKDYPNRKDKRKKYRGAKAFDTTCRNHRGCNVCLSNRTISEQKRKQSADDQLKDLGSENV